jgi:hypothetical protein
MKTNVEGSIATRPGTRRSAQLWVVVVTLALASIGVATPAMAAPPSNDTRAGAVEVGALPFTYTQSARHATADGPRRCLNHGSVFFRFQPDTAVDVQVDTVGSSYDTVLTVFTMSPDGPHLVGCSDDRIGPWGAVRFSARAGRQYYFMVANWWRAGDLRLNVAEVTDDPFEGDVTVESSTVDPDTGIATIAGTVTCNQPSALGLQGELRQLRGEIFVARGWFYQNAYCLPGSLMDWSVDVDSETGVAFGTGDARIRWDSIGLRDYGGRHDLTPTDPTLLTLT